QVGRHSVAPCVQPRCEALSEIARGGVIRSVQYPGIALEDGAVHVEHTATHIDHIEPRRWLHLERDLRAVLDHASCSSVGARASLFPTRGTTIAACSHRICRCRSAMTLSSAAFLIPLGAGICAWSACHPSSQLFGPTQRRTGRERTIALTFDDGPNPAATPQILDLLERYEARGTFFVIGRHVRACAALAAEIVARGHTIGNHTDTHPNLLWLSRRQVLDELERCDASIA